MSTDEARENLERVFPEIAAELGPRVGMQETFNSAELHGVRKEHVVEIVEGVLSVSGTTDDEIKATLLRMIDDAYRGQAA
jgi:hypothetical protein